MTGNAAESVVVGFGHCGRDLHLAALLESGVRTPSQVFAVDRDPLVADGTGIPVLRSVAAAAAILRSPAETVWHITSPPATHERLLGEVLAVGARRVVVEKPVGGSADAAGRMLRAAARIGARLIPVAIWPHSKVTEAVVAAGGQAPGVSLVFEQSKPRGNRTVTDRGHRSAWDVEMPHQVVLALHLAGPVARVVSADMWDAQIGGLQYPEMGGARLVVEHRGGGRSVLLSDLNSPVHVRRLRLLLPNGELMADYPVSGATVGRLRQPDGSSRAVTCDRPLTRFIASAYREFAQPGSAVTVPDDLHLASLAVIEEAAAIARRRSEPREIPRARAVL